MEKDRLTRECEKLDKAEERALADAGLAFDMKEFCENEKGICRNALPLMDSKEYGRL